MYSGVFYIAKDFGGAYCSNPLDSVHDDLFGFDASRCSPIYGTSKTVQPRSYVVYYIIKIQK